MAEEPKKLDEITLGDDESVPEKFRGKSVKDVLTSYKEAEDLAHEKSEEVTAKDKEIEALKNQPDPDPIVDPTPDPDPDPDYSDLYGDDEYVTKESVEKRFADIEKKNEENLKAAEERATSNAMAQIEKRQFIDSHPEIFDGKSPEEANAVIKKIAGAGFVAGKETLEGGLTAIQEMSTELGLVAPPVDQSDRDIPTDLKTIGEFDSPNDEIAHMKEVHKQQKGKISSLLGS
jgi:hypothetical protein